jgi:hypothetical protein
MAGETLEEGAEIAVGLDAMTLAAGNEAIQVGGPHAAGVAAGKEPVLAADGDRA